MKSATNSITGTGMTSASLQLSRWTITASCSGGKLVELKLTAGIGKTSRGNLKPEALAAAIEILESYISDPRKAMKYGYGKESITVNGSCELDLSAYTAAEIRVMKELTSVPPGNVISYSKLAEMSGISGGARFAGNVMAGNPIPILVPCHRVVIKNGSIGGFTGGTDLKEYLLAIEGR